jgi:hypothetical protein
MGTLDQPHDTTYSTSGTMSANPDLAALATSENLNPVCRRDQWNNSLILIVIVAHG